MLRHARDLFERLTAWRRDDPGPVPPRRLRSRTGAPGAREFSEGGRLAAGELVAALGESAHTVSGLLDFGCGSGRVLPHMAALLPQARSSGCDVDPVAIGWAARHLPHLGWAVSGSGPPLPFATPSFELIYSISVFSHLDEPLQDDWLTELARSLLPGGTALLSVHGQHAFEQFRSGVVRTGWCPPRAFARGPLGNEEFVFEPYVRSVWNRGELPGVGEQYGLAFHGEGYLRTHWSEFFEVLEVRPRALSAWQDLVVCRRRME